MNCFPVVDDISDSQMWSAATLLSEAINALLFTLTLMHCRNTQLLDREPDPHLSRKYEKRYGVPMTRYKVLKVTSMRKWRADAGSAEPDTDTLPKSLHIVRGHFKDYRHGNGLWGRYRDIFWWDAHVRGDEKRGIVAKDYEVEPEGD